MAIKMTPRDIMHALADDMGFCVACGAEHYGCEPDARNYECEECGAHEVHGLEEIILVGHSVPHLTY